MNAKKPGVTDTRKAPFSPVFTRFAKSGGSLEQPEKNRLLRRFGGFCENGRFRLEVRCSIQLSYGRIARGKWGN
jgi:hypothetical protein